MNGTDKLAIVILAAGKGTRMKSDLAKVLHLVAGKSMVVHVVECARKLAPEQIYVVVGHQAQQVEQEVKQYFNAHFVLQKKLNGTGDAVKSVVPFLPPHIQHVLVLCGDVPLIQEQTLRLLVNGHLDSKDSLTVLAVNVDNPTGYGRIVQDDSGEVLCIREEADASACEKKINTVNSGIYCFDRDFLVSGIEKIQCENNQAEYYLTDLVEIARVSGKKISVVLMDDPRQVMGVNTLEELARAEALIHELDNELS